MPKRNLFAELTEGFDALAAAPKPNAQAALLIHMVDRFPDTVKRLAAV